MKILILSNSAEGLYDFRFELIQRMLDEGYEVFLSLPESEDDKKAMLLKKSGAKYIRTDINRRGMNFFEDIKLIKKYNNIIKNIKPDLVFTYTIKPNIYGSIVSGIYKIPVIINITGLGSTLQNSKIKRLIIILYRYACSKARVVFFQNKSNREFFMSNGIVKGTKTRLIPGSGVNINKFVPQKKSNNDQKIKFLFFGRIMREKGINEFLAAAQQVTKKYDNTEFLMLGYFEEQEYKYLEKGMENQRIRYIGSSDNVREVIKEVDCIINPSYHEGMSNVLLEGAAMGKPLIASNIPGCKEIIDDGENGYLFEVGSAKSLEEKIIRFIELNQEEREKMGHNSRRKIESEFNRDIVVDEYMEAINYIMRSE